MSRSKWKAASPTTKAPAAWKGKNQITDVEADSRHRVSGRRPRSLRAWMSRLPVPAKWQRLLPVTQSVTLRCAQMDLHCCHSRSPPPPFILCWSRHRSAVHKCCRIPWPRLPSCILSSFSQVQLKGGDKRARSGDRQEAPAWRSPRSSTDDGTAGSQAT
ncbi:hypothetical protein GN956_G26097 [Arapaima gigas]